MMWPRRSKEFSKVACGSTSTERTVSIACHVKGVDSWLFGGMRRLLQMSRYLLHHLLDDLGARPVCPCPSGGAFRCPRLGNGCVQSHHPRRNLHPLCHLTVMKAVASAMNNRTRVVGWFPSGIRLRNPAFPVQSLSCCGRPSSLLSK